MTAIKVMQHVRTQKWELRCLVHTCKGGKGVRKETSYVYNTKAEAEADVDNVVAGLEWKSSRRVLSRMIACICRRKQVTRFRDPMKPVKKRHYFPREKISLL